MGRNTNLSLKPHGGGKSIPSANQPTTKKKMATGKIVGAKKAPLPSQKKSKGSGLAGRGTRG